nr:endonuclease domain-containing protein [uncultured Sphingomonas sp.]
MTTERARQLRKQMTPPELRLWNALKTRPGGFKFRKQHPSDPYVLDFFCNEAALAIEVDGAAHIMGDNPTRDEKRDRFLADQGILTLRFAAIDIRDNLDGVVVHIVETCRSRTP